MTHSFFDVPLADIRESTFNPRKTFDLQALTDLTASVKAQGVLQPILLRPIPHDAGGPEYEIVAGARRFRAAKAARLETIPAIVRDLGDREALELALLENIQREDLPPLEEGRSFAALHKEHGFPAAELAAKAGKSVSYVYGRIQLGELPAKVQRYLETGDILVGAAMAVARIPDPKRQAEAADEIVRRSKHQGQPMSVAGARDLVERQYMLELREAPFDRHDPKLVEFAPACTACPKRTGNQLDLWGEASGPDLCTDKACWQKKADAAWRQAARKAKAEQIEVVEADHAVALEYQDLAAVCYDDPQRRSYLKLLGGKRAVDRIPERTLVRRPDTGGAEIRLPKRELRKLLRAAGHDFWKKKKAEPAAEDAETGDEPAKQPKAISQAANDAVWVRAIAQLREAPLLLETLRECASRWVRDIGYTNDAQRQRWGARDSHDASVVDTLTLADSAALLFELSCHLPAGLEQLSIDKVFGLGTAAVWKAEETVRLEQEAGAAAAAAAAKQPKAKKRAAKAGAK